MTRENAWKDLGVNEIRIDEGLVWKITDELYGSKYQFLRDEALYRITQVNTFYDYYDLKGQYWSMPSKLGYKPTVMPVNLARWFVRRRSSWMFETAPDVECPSNTVDPPEEMEKVDYEPSKKQKKLDDQASAREQMIYKVWGDNRFDEKLLSAGKDYFVAGTVGLKIVYLPGRGVRYQFAPAQEIFPIPNDEDPDVFDKIHFCCYYDNDSTLWRQTWEMIGGKCYLSEGLYAASNLELIKGRYNRYDTGLDFLPVLIFPHQPLSGDIFGMSYLKDLVPIMDQYNRSLSDAADSLRFNMFAITVLLNAPPDAEKQLKISPQELWNIGGDQVDAKKLESSFNYSNALADFLTRLENVMHLIGDVPDITPDRIKGFGLVSGVALKLLYSDLVSATQQDWRVWKSRLVKANEYVLRMLEIYSKTDSTFPYDFKTGDIAGDYDNRIIPHLPLPENEAEKITMEVNKLKNSMQSVKGALQEIGEKFPEKKIAEIIAEREKFLEDTSAPLGKELNVTEEERMAGL